MRRVFVVIAGALVAQTVPPSPPVPPKADIVSDARARKGAF